ncbi:hypothetical protein G6F24_016257 [Rhizopus arrhizus]|nr:hypothetical protein G6F24_016257 [Rhizopus arrhizus]
MLPGVFVVDAADHHGRQATLEEELDHRIAVAVGQYQPGQHQEPAAILAQQAVGLGQGRGDHHRQFQALLDGLAQHAGEGTGVFDQQDPLWQRIGQVAIDGGLRQDGHDAPEPSVVDISALPGWGQLAGNL